MSEKAIDFDFDNFDEEAALVAAAEDVGVKTAFGGGVFAGKFRDGTVVRIPLEVPKKLVAGLGDEFEQLAPDDQLLELLRAMGLGDRADAVLRQGMIAAVVFASRFFETLTKVTKVALGE